MQPQLQDNIIRDFQDLNRRLSKQEQSYVQDSVKVGTMIIWPTTAGTLPSNYKECNGATYDRTQYGALFSLIGTTHGVGDGSTTFGIPSYTLENKTSLDPWHAIGGSGEPAYLNSWRTYAGAGGYPGARFRINSDGMVTVSGLMDKNGGNFISLESFFTLPTGYRPDTQMLFSTKMAGTTGGENDGRIDVKTDGNVILNTGGNANPVAYVSLEGIQFYIATPPTFTPAFIIAIKVL